MREGSLDAPVRHPIDWENPDFYDEEKLDADLRYAFDVCHGCRRCFNLCDSFPRLFDLIDDSQSGELDSVSSEDFKSVADACTLCDMCFMVKCPYVPPHEFNLDFPHLMLRYRAVEYKKGGRKIAEQELTKTDRNGKIATRVSSLANWASATKNNLTRPVMEKALGVHRKAALPRFSGKTLLARMRDAMPAVKPSSSPRKAVIYATCYGNYNMPEVGEAAIHVLAKNGVTCEVVYPECCGMPQMEQGNLSKVAGKAANVAATLKPWIDKGYDVIALMPSCALMLKFEWPRLLPENTDIDALSRVSYDLSEYVVDLAKNNGLAEGLSSLDASVSVHIACHARAQNMGKKGEELLKLIPDIDLNVVERCSGHGGSWGIMKDNFETAMKVGRPVFRQMKKNDDVGYITSECPLAGEHIAQGMTTTDNGEKSSPKIVAHPILLLARAYGLGIG